MNDLNQLKNFLNLEKILVIKKIELLCLPKDNNEEFKNKMSYVKKIHPNIEFKIIEDTEIETELIIDIFNYKNYLPMVI